MVRCRFAPSPTGPIHIGSVRTALYNYLFARHEKGKMLLRIEDTDQTRSKDEYTKEITDCLSWLGLDWDETYHQSKRLDLYREKAKELVAKGKAYEREDPGKGTCLVYKIHREYIEWDDLIHRRIGRDISKDPDVVILKSDGWATYNFACVVDDIDMKITHVVRADDHVSNTPKQISLYRAFGVEPPLFAHIPLILNPDGSKMSKDYKKQGKGGVEVSIMTHMLDYKAKGYLPETIVNFLTLLGWSPGDDREVLSKEEIISLFTMDRVNNKPAQFNPEKLTWMNGHYIRKKTVDELVQAVRPHLEKNFDLTGVDNEMLKKLAAQQQERLKTLDEIVPLTSFFFKKEIQFDERCFQKYLTKESAKPVLTSAISKLQALDKFDKAMIEQTLRSIADEKKLSFKDVSQPIRVAVTGSDISPPIDETLEIVGKDEIIKRLEHAVKSI